MNKHIVFATSFSPEYSKSIGDNNPLESLQVIHKDLHINDFRLGLRWNRVDFDNNLTLSNYDKYIQYCLKNNCKICLNVGPIKVMRWPEEHIPERINVDGIRVVKRDSELAKQSLEYFNKLLQLLKKTYGEDLSPQRGISFQIENEGYNRFGHKGIVMSQEYMVDVSNALHEQYPDNNLMIDSAGRNDLRKIVNLFKELIDMGIYSSDMLTLGVNYYFRFPIKPNLLKRYSVWTFAKPFSLTLGQVHNYQRELGFGLEISEAQMEPWGTQTLPGNSYEEFEYLVENAIKLFPEEYPTRLIRLWGTEELALKIKTGNVTNEHLAIMGDIKEGNKNLV